MIMPLFILAHSGGTLYLASKTGLTTHVRDKALRGSSRSEVSKWKKHVKLPLMWDVEEVQYDTLTGQLLPGVNKTLS